MESFLKDILIHILSYLQGEDVARFKQLNSNFLELITINRKYLRHPKLSIDLITSYEDPNQNVEIKVNNCWVYKIIDLKPVYTPLKQWAKKRSRKDFFGPFFERKLPEHDLRAFFDFLLEKGDIVELRMHSCLNARCISILTEAVKSTPSQIRRATVDPFLSGTESECLSFLKALGNHNRKTKRFPLIMLSFPACEIRQYWTQLRILNTISSKFSLALLEFGSHNIDEVLKMIATEWRESPFPTFHFRIFIDAKFSEPWKIDTNDMQDDFRITVDDESKIVRFEDLDYGDFIQFQKREAVYDHYGYETLDSMDIVITAHIE